MLREQFVPAEIARSYEDGGAACLSPTRSGVLRGIGHADSVTVDFHKTFYQPVACSAVLLRDDQSLAHVRTHAEYLNPADAPQLNLADYSLQTTRRFDALNRAAKVLLDPAALPVPGFDSTALHAQRAVEWMLAPAVAPHEPLEV